MKLEFLYQPVGDAKQALAFYRDALGWEEAWREGEKTISLQMPGTDVQLMLDETEDAPPFRPGPAFVVDEVRDFYEAKKEDLTFRGAPIEIPGGYWVSFEDPFGNTVYVMDQSEQAE